jgi:hypothetical protein
MSTLSQQASAVETAYRIAAGGIKAPRPNSEQGKYLAEHLREAATTLRQMEAKNDAHR